MKTELPVALKPVSQFFAKHHAVIFISLIVLLLAVAVYVLYTASKVVSTEEPVSTIGQFDQATVEKIKGLHDSTDTFDKLVFPTPRSNPFTE